VRARARRSASVVGLNPNRRQVAVMSVADDGTYLNRGSSSRIAVLPLSLRSPPEAACMPPRDVGRSPGETADSHPATDEPRVERRRHRVISIPPRPVYSQYGSWP
jgi:hypothetical protein